MATLVVSVQTTSATPPLWLLAVPSDPDPLSRQA